MFKQNLEKINYPQIEEKILGFWQEHKIFEKSVDSRDAKKSYTFYEGPPTANGMPGIHHVMARTIKDLICRYKTIQGYRVERRAGWDTHGLPVELEVEKKIGIKQKNEIVDYGVEEYNKRCRESVFTYLDQWEKMTQRMGYWIDLDKAYITLSNDYIESVWWALKTLFDKGLIYKDYKIVPQDPKAETVMSSHELSLGYRETKDPSVYVFFKIKNSADDYFLVWTTTPWTLISNVALAVGPDIDYVKIKLGDRNIILAKDRLAVITDEYEIIEEFKGSTLEHTYYDQLMNYVTPDKKAFYVTAADFVSTGDGSGIVHIAPAFGQDDYDLSKKYNLPMLQPVTRGGLFTEEVTDFKGQFVKDADKEIIVKLKEENKLYKKETITHSYPFSWRNENVPIIYYARDSWYIKTTSVADRMVSLNNEINWQPAEVGSGRFGNWLEENKDWALSRDRFWAAPLPIWISEDGDMFAVGSIEELKQGYVEKDGKKVSVSELKELDLHKPFIDTVLFEKNGKVYKRTPELIDVWFESGAMPFAQLHYPFENKELFEKSFPADFISEGIDQTRGWFYTLHAIATMLFDKPAFKNIIVNELILDKNGHKMSKRLGNSVDPFDMFSKYGADATRWYLITNSPPWRTTKFNEEDLAETQRKFFGTLLNTYSFLALYANIDNFNYEEADVPYTERPEIDRWIISKLNSMVKEYEKQMEAYDIYKAALLISTFAIDHLSNWYVRRCRRRFWKSEMNQNKVSAYQTLYECLIVITKLASPFIPFLSEEIYQNLNGVTKKEEFESVHLSRFPNVTYIDSELEERMEIAQRVVYLTRAMRAKANLKVRQPLAKIMVVVDKAKRKALVDMKDVILDEVNIKDLIVLEDDSEIVNKTAKANFKAIGPKFGKKVKSAAALISQFGKEDIKKLEAGNNLILDIEGESISISREDVEIISTEITGWVVESEEGVIVAIDAELTDDLIAEGYAREFVNRIQNLRKDSDYNVTDRINIKFNSSGKFADAIIKFKDYISTETLAENLEQDNQLNGETELKVGDFNCSVKIEKAN